jgi:hypothetical protein
MKSVVNSRKTVGEEHVSASASALALRRVTHEQIVEQPKFHTVKDAEGNFQSTLKLSDKTLLLLPDLREKTEFEGEKCASKKEADNSAAKAFWDDPHVLEIARTLKPSKKAQKIREHFDFVKCKEQREANAKRVKATVR